MVEKEEMNQKAVAENWWIYYEHDLAHEMSKIALNEKNQFEAVNFATIDIEIQIINGFLLFVQLAEVFYLYRQIQLNLCEFKLNWPGLAYSLQTVS